MDATAKAIIEFVQVMKESQQQYLKEFPDMELVKGKLSAFNMVEEFINNVYGDKDEKN